MLYSLILGANATQIKLQTAVLTATVLNQPSKEHQFCTKVLELPFSSGLAYMAASRRRKSLDQTTRDLESITPRNRLTDAQRHLLGGTPVKHKVNPDTRHQRLAFDLSQIWLLR